MDCRVKTANLLKDLLSIVFWFNRHDKVKDGQMYLTGLQALKSDTMWTCGFILVPSLHQLRVHLPAEETSGWMGLFSVFSKPVMQLLGSVQTSISPFSLSNLWLFSSLTPRYVILLENVNWETKHKQSLNPSTPLQVRATNNWPWLKPVFICNTLGFFVEWFRSLITLDFDTSRNSMPTLYLLLLSSFLTPTGPELGLQHENNLNI